jgi:hypothetical protein
MFVLVLDQADFQQARLRTRDGHSHHTLMFAFGTALLTIADVGMAGLEGY